MANPSSGLLGDRSSVQAPVPFYDQRFTTVLQQPCCPPASQLHSLSMNIQPVSGPDFRADGALLVHSVFPTIQGEGPLAGVPATFIRLAGCNLQCPACDTEYTLGSQLTDPARIAAQVSYLPHPLRHNHLVVITGGEPFRQNIGPLVRRLVTHGYRVQLETNGTLYVPGTWSGPGVSIVCSPKTPRIHPQLEPYITAFKYVLDADHVDADGLPTVTMLGVRPYRPSASSGIPIYVQPLDEGDAFKNGFNRRAAIESCLNHGYTLCLQLHKIVGVE